MGLTKENRTEFVTNMTRLALWYLGNKTKGKANPELFRNILTVETPVYRLTGLWDGIHHPANPSLHDGQWEKIEKYLYDLLKKSPEKFEENAYAMLEPLVLGRIETDLKAWPWTPCGYCPYKLPEENVFGAFAFEVAKLSADSDEIIAIHIGNNKIPESPFKDMENLRKELTALVNYVSEKHPAVKKIGCSSWLNDFSRFLDMFPPEWGSTCSKPNQVAYGYNWWGQFVSRTGGFNFRNAEKMRQTGTFPFNSLSGSCTIESLRKHLE